MNDIIDKIEYEVGEVYAVLRDFRKGIINNYTLADVIDRQIDRLGTVLDYIEELNDE